MTKAQKLLKQAAVNINSNSGKSQSGRASVTRKLERKTMALTLNKPSSTKAQEPAKVETPAIDSTVPVKGETAGVPAPITNTAGIDNSRRALRFITKLEADEGFMHDIVLAMDANDISRAGGFIIMLDMKRALPAELINELPTPDSEGGNNPDLYPIEDTKRKGHFYFDFFDLTAKGKEIVFQLDQIALVKDTKTFNSAEEKFKAMDADVRDKLEARLKARRNYGRGVLKQAASLIIKLQEIETGLPNMAVKYPEDATEPTPRPFILHEKANPMAFKALTASELLSINVEKANAKVPGGSKVAVLETMGKEARGPQKNEGDDDEGVQVTGDTFEDTLIAMSNFVRDIYDDKKLLGRFYAKLNGREGDGLLMALFDLNDLIDRMIDKPELRDRNAKLQLEYASKERKSA